MRSFKHQIVYFNQRSFPLISFFLTIGKQILNYTYGPSFDHITYTSNFPMGNVSSLALFAFQELSTYGIKNPEFAQDLPPIYIFVPTL